MHQPSRPQNRSDGSTVVTPTQGSERDPPPPAGAAGALAQTSRSDSGGERGSVNPSSTGGGGGQDAPSRRRTKTIPPLDSLGVFQTRSIFHLPRRKSSGYFSSDGESQPSSPLSPRPATADRATQTPSPTGQVMQHALQRMAVEHGGGPGTHQQHGHPTRPSSMRPSNAAGAMQMEAIGQELRRIGDDFNRLLLLRGVAGRNGRVVIRPNPLPHIHQEPAVLLCVGLLLLLIGRIILQGSTDHSQV